MFGRRLLFTNARATSCMMLCALVLLVTAQALSVTHDLTHNEHEHEQTELCEVLGSFGANKAVIALEVTLGFFPLSQTDIVTPPSSLFDTKVILNQRSRAPPVRSLS